MTENDKNRIDKLEDDRLDSLCDQVAEIHRILVIGNGSEAILVTVRKNAMKLKALTWCLGIVYTALIGGVVKYFMG